MNVVINQLKENLQLLYRKAIDADENLNKLKSQGKGKHGSIFDSNAGFTVSSKQFKPYVEEVALDVEGLLNKEPEELQQSLPDIVKKMELLFKTMANFRLTLDD